MTKPLGYRETFQHTATGSWYSCLTYVAQEVGSDLVGGMTGCCRKNLAGSRIHQKSPICAYAVLAVYAVSDSALNHRLKEFVLVMGPAVATWSVNLAQAVERAGSHLEGADPCVCCHLDHPRHAEGLLFDVEEMTPRDFDHFHFLSS